MKDNIARTLREKCSLERGDHITVALSGGQDSIVLTQMLLALSDELGFTLSALHIHHGLRAASDSEEIFVREYCRQNSLELEVRHLNLDGRNESLEMAAREARYAVFGEFIAPHRFVATAHHREDCMETFFINLCRGCGSKGLGAIPYKRDGIIRPMLDIPKEEITCYAVQNGLQWVEDESNTDIYYLRNFIRRCILPELKSRKDVSFAKGFETTLQNLREEAAYLDEVAAKYADTDDAATLAPLPRPLLWRVLKGRCAELTRERFDTVARRLPQGDFTEQITADIYCKVQKGQLSFYKKLPPIPLTPLSPRVELEDKIIEFTEIHSQFTNFDIDCAKIKTEPMLRSKLTGDRFCKQSGKEYSLSRLFQKYQFTDKDRRIVITDGENVLYAEGLGASAPFTPDADTVKALRIKIKENENANT